MMHNIEEDISFTKKDILILHSSFLEICYGIRIDNFEKVFSVTKKKCLVVYKILKNIIDNYNWENNDNKIIVKHLNISNLILFYSVLSFVKNDLINELHTRTGFNEVDFNLLIKKILMILNEKSR